MKCEYSIECDESLNFCIELNPLQRFSQNEHLQHSLEAMPSINWQLIEV